MPPVRFGVHIHIEGPVQKVIERVQLAEELGYDSVWVGDSQLIMPEPYTVLGACALNTKRITLGIGVSNTRTRHPTVIASGLAALADLAPGRVAAVIGVGGSSHGALGWKHDRLVDFRRNYELIARLLQGEEVPYNGRELRLVWATPEHTRQVRLFVHAGGPKGQRQAGEMGCPVQLPGLIRELPEALERVNAGAAAVGRTVRDRDVCWWGSTAISDDWQAIKEHMAASMSMRIAGSYRALREGRIQEDDLVADIDLARRVYEVHDSVEHAIGSSRAAQLVLQQPDELWKEWVKTSLIGTPEEVAERLRPALEHEALSDIVVSPRLSTGRLSVETIMEAFAKQVRPLLSSGQGATPHRTSSDTPLP